MVWLQVLLAQLTRCEIPADKKVVRFGPGAGWKSTDLVERRIVWPLRPILWASPSIASDGRVQCHQCYDCCTLCGSSRKRSVREQEIHQAFQRYKLTPQSYWVEESANGQYSGWHYTMLIQQLWSWFWRHSLPSQPTKEARKSLSWQTWRNSETSLSNSITRWFWAIARCGGYRDFLWRRYCGIKPAG